MFELRRRIHIDNKKLEILIESVRTGVPIKYACHKAQIPEFYYYKWLKLFNDYMSEIESKGIEIEKEVLQPKPEGKSKNITYSYSPVSLILKIKEAYADFVISNHQKIVDGDKSWTASAWLLERRCRDDYGKEEAKTETINQIPSIKVVYVDPNKDETKSRLEELTKEVNESINGTNRN